MRRSLVAVSGSYPRFGALVARLLAAGFWGSGVLAAVGSPAEVAFDPGGSRVAVSDARAGQLVFVDVGKGEIVARMTGLGGPVGLVWSPDGSRLFVAERQRGTVAAVDPRSAVVLARWEVGGMPMAVAWDATRSRLGVTLDASAEVVFVDVAAGRVARRVAVKRQPRSLAFSADGRRAVVGNLLPAGGHVDPRLSAAVSVLDLEEGVEPREVRLPSGSTLARGVAVVRDGRWGVVAHAVGRFTLPSSQIDRGWINGNALSLVDLQAGSVYATVLLDRFADGAAEPWDLCVSDAGDTVWVTLAGVHELAKVNLRRVLELLDGTGALPEGSKARPSLWREVRRNPAVRPQLGEDLDALTQARALDRWQLPVKGPRGLDLSPDGRLLAVAGYFSGDLLWVDADTGRVRGRVEVGEPSTADSVRWGEFVFHDATYSMQRWLSCSTCHPDGRVDGLNWDLMNDGLGNMKSTKSLVWAHLTPPMMARGVRPDLEYASQAGFRFTQDHEPSAEALEAVRAYIRSLQPEPGPARLPGGGFSGRALVGKAVFERSDVGCARCHPGPLFTDLKLHAVGTGRGREMRVAFDTPSLVELWRTAPYLHHGMAETVEEVLVRFNPADEHGATRQLSEDEIQALAEYLLSL